MSDIFVSMYIKSYFTYHRNEIKVININITHIYQVRECLFIIQISRICATVPGGCECNAHARTRERGRFRSIEDPTPRHGAILLNTALLTPLTNGNAEVISGRTAVRVLLCGVLIVLYPTFYVIIKTISVLLQWPDYVITIDLVSF